MQADDYISPTETLLAALRERPTVLLSLAMSRRARDVHLLSASPVAPDDQALASLPSALFVDKPVILDVRETRISLVWTQICGTRPTHFAAAPTGVDDVYLVLVCAGACGITEDELSFCSLLLSRLHGQGLWQSHVRGSERVASLVDQLSMPIVFADSGSVDIVLNDSARRLLRIADSVDKRGVAGALARLLAGASARDDALLAVDPKAALKFDIVHDDQHFEVESRWVSLPSLQGRLWTFRDVTEERKLARFKDDVVSNVSHELRTPLTSIKGALALLREPGLIVDPERKQSLIAIAASNADRLAKLVNDLLDLDKLQAGKLEVRFTSFDLGELVRGTLEQCKPIAELRLVQLKFQNAARDLAIVSDPDRLAQVVTNLVANAIKFSPDGGIVEVRLDDHQRHLAIAVSDSGPGISAEFRKRLFGRFEQDDIQHTETSGGTGLGLAISKALVEQLGGKLSAPKSEYGAVFLIDLPRDVSLHASDVAIP